MTLIFYILGKECTLLKVDERYIDVLITRLHTMRNDYSHNSLINIYSVLGYHAALK